MTPESPPPPPAPPRGRSRRRTVLRTVLLLAFAVSGWVAWLALPRKDAAGSRPRPGATVVFHLAHTPPTLLHHGGPPAPGEFEAYGRAQAALVRSRLVLSSALKLPGVAQLGVWKEKADPISWLAETLRVSFDAPEIMRVELDGEPADEVVTVLNAVARAYLAEVGERDTAARRHRLAQLELKHREYVSEGERFRSQLNKIAVALGSSDAQTLAVTHALLRDDLRTATRELTDARSALLSEDPGASSDPGRVGALRRRAALAAARVEDIRKSLAEANKYRLEMENAAAAAARADRMGAALGEEIERLKVELSAPARVTIMEEARARPAR